MSQVTSESILTTKEIVEQAIKDYHAQILPYLNGSYPTPIANKIAKGNIYSEEEKMIGQWIDGKPIYQIVSSSPEAITDSALFKPMMTDNSVPSPYVVTSSDLFNGNMQPYKAFDNARYLNGDPDFTDGKDSYYWMTSQIAGSWIKIDLGENNAKEFVNVGLGAIGTSYINDLPRSFTISGSNDDNDYTVLYTSDPDRENGADTDTYLVENFEFERTGRYRYYKLDVNTVFAGGNVRVDCIKFYEAAQSIAPNIDKVLSKVHMDNMYVYQYTKVDDEPVEFGSITDYSTTEKVVGTWIDGKPVYQIVSDLEDPTAGVLFKPDMTGNNEPSPYAVTSSTLYNTNMQPYKAFDDVRYTPSDPDYRTGADAYYWMSSAVANSWIKIDLGENNAKEFASIGIGVLKTSTYDGRSCMPRSFTVSGSNDDSDYTVLYTSDPNRENTANENNYYVETFNFTTTGSYRYYKIDINTSFGGENIRIDCIKFREQGLIRNVDTVLSNVVKGGKHVLQYTKTTD